MTEAGGALTALRASEARYRALAEATSQVIWGAGPNGELGDVLDGWRVYTGQTIAADRPAGRDEWLAAVHPDDRASAWAAWTKALHEGSLYEARYRLRRRDGVYRLVVVRAAPVRDDGHIAEWIGTITDVTEAERARLELETERARLAEAQEIARLGSWHWTRDGGVRVTAQWANILAVDDAAVRADPVAALRQVLAPEELERLEARIRDIESRQLATTSSNWRVRRRDGGVGVLHVTARWEFDAHGRRVSGTGTFQDITELATAQEQVARQRALLEESQRLAHVGSWELDLSARIVLWSDEMYRIAGLPFDEGTMTLDAAGALVHPHDRAYVSEQVASAVASGQAEVEYEHRLLRGDGEARMVFTRARIVRGADGGVVRMVGSTQDVTDRRHLEEQFRQTQKMEALGALAGGIAHDFNNLLTAIIGGVDLAREEVPADSVIAADLKDVRHAALRAAELTRQLLAFSRKQPHRPRVLDLNETVRRAEGLLRRLLPRDAITLDVLPGQMPAILRADATQIEQVLVNLVVNARDAIEAVEHSGETSGGVIAVEVGMREVREARMTTSGTDIEPGWYTALVVRDTGVGMTAATMGRIFEPFFTTKPEGRGTGLGLATVFGIVVQAGGGIDVDSTPGAGTTFTVLLPAVEEPLDDAETDASSMSSRGSETVLLVDDERVVRETAKRILERHGYLVFAARHGADALLIWSERAEEIDVVLTDVRMPTMGGRALVERLRQDRAGLPVVVMSGYTSEHDEAESTMLQREIFLEKPFTAESLLTHVREALDRHRAPLSA